MSDCSSLISLCCPHEETKCPIECTALTEQEPGPREYKTFFMSMKFQLTKTKMLKNKDISYFKLSDVFVMLINVKMPTIVGILTFMGKIHLRLSRFEHEKSFMT